MGGGGKDGGKKGGKGAPGKGGGKGRSRENGGGGSRSGGYVPRRGGGEWGKRQRQMEQQQIKDEKTRREIDYFWECQQQNLAKGSGKRTGRGRLAVEERELFSAHENGVVGIDFKKYDNIPVELSGKDVEEIPAIHFFEDLWENFDLPDFLWENIERCKYKVPTPIQKNAVPAALNGRDAMCCAQTGSGKTLAFLFPIFSALDPEYGADAGGDPLDGEAAPQALILAPTRELCSQIHLEARKLGFSSPFRCVEVYGGVDARPQLKDLARGADLVTATPGRLIDFVDRGVMTLEDISFLVLDEADRMLDMGFEPQIREIVEKRNMPSDTRQTLMFSATFPREIQKLAKNFLWNYVWVGIGVVGAAVDTVQQQFVLTSDPDKSQKLLDLLWEHKEDTTLVFCAMKRTAAWLENHLHRNGLSSAAIHGDMEQREREASLTAFRSGRKSILVATDVAARGLDIPEVSHVVNYDLPSNIDDYVHRIGRTGRIGRKGWATSFYVKDGRRGNANILRDLIKILKGAGQQVPDFLLEEASWGGGGGKNDRGSAFGGRDIRKGDRSWGDSGHKSGGKGGRPGGKPVGSGKGGGYGGSGGKNGGYRDGQSGGNRSGGGYGGGGGYGSRGGSGREGW